MAAGENSPAPLPGATYRFIVKSAEEAVRMIQEKFGTNARVVSVKQIGGSGLAGLLRAPQLEVIAEVTAAPAHPSPAAAAPVAPVPAPAPFAVPPQSTDYFVPTTPPPHVPAAPVVPVPPAAPVEDESAWLHQDPVPAAPVEPLERLLARAGIGEQMISRWRRSPRWEVLIQRPLGEALKEIVEMLRAQWPDVANRPPGARVAFFGPPGSGSTTALCKALTIDIFFHQQPSVVLKLQGEQPNPTEGLAMFCEALDVPLLRSAEELESVHEGCRCYFDATGFPLNDAAPWRDLGHLFGEFYIDTRVLVLNAAYDIDLLKRAYTLGREADATHVVFTHLDEVQRWGKLWELILSGGLYPLFFSCGQNVSGDLREDTFELMVQRMIGGQKR